MDRITRDLLAALKRLIDDADDRGETKNDDGQDFEDWAQARAAIAQAEAEQAPYAITYANAIGIHWPDGKSALIQGDDAWQLHEELDRAAPEQEADILSQFRHIAQPTN